MAFSTQRAVSDGTLQDLLLEIEFIDRENVNVFIDDVPQVVDVDYEWISDTLIRFAVPVPDGSEVLLQRNTELNQVLNIFTLGAVFNNPTMDENFRQILFIAQEAREGSTLEDVFRNLNMHGYRIQNLGAGTEPGDAINYQQYVDDALGAGNARIAAEAARNAAIAARDSASASATTATTQAGIASAHAAAALGSATAAAAAAVETGEDVAAVQLLYDAIAVTPGGGMKPLLYPEWSPARAIIQAGYVAADGQVLSRATYADAWAQAQLAGLVVTDAAWLSTPTERGKFSSGDGSTTFRLPDYNGKAAGSLGAVFLRGDGTLSAAIAGEIQRDAFQGHAHSASLNGGADAGTGSTIQGTTSAFLYSNPAVVVGSPTPDGTNGTPRTAAETRPLNVTGCWVIKLFGAVVNVGSADAAQLASDYANLASRVSALEGVRPVLRTAVSASGTAVDFTGIPSWVNRVTVMLSGVSTTGASPVILQLGAGAAETSGYSSTSTLILGTAANTASFTSGIGINYNSAADNRTGAYDLSRLGGNTWVARGIVHNPGAAGTATITGAKTLAGALDRIRLTTVNGTDVFDAGSINILYGE